MKINNNNIQIPHFVRNDDPSLEETRGSSGGEAAATSSPSNYETSPFRRSEATEKTNNYHFKTNLYHESILFVCSRRFPTLLLD